MLVVPKVGTAWLFESSDEKTGVTGRAGFPRDYRLTKAGQFSSVFNFRKSIKSEHFLLHYRFCGNVELHRVRLGLIVAKRSLRRSVDRTLIKRLVRETFRVHRLELPSCDLIVRLVVRLDLPVNRQKVAEEIRILLEKLVSLG